MSNQVPYATRSDEQRIIARLMCDGYSLSEIEAGFALQAKRDGNFTADSVRSFIWKARAALDAGIKGE